jgi:hypothetical protein
MSSGSSHPGLRRPSVPCGATHGPSSAVEQETPRFVAIFISPVAGRDPEAGDRSAAVPAHGRHVADHRRFAHAAQHARGHCAVRRRESSAAVMTTSARRFRMPVETAFPDSRIQIPSADSKRLGFGISYSVSRNIGTSRNHATAPSNASTSTTRAKKSS